jgi:energy-coupling factor transporter ATP-binding protein EcfA2
MARFEHLRLKEHKGLKQATLLDLRKINVVCGPNNSGKTTVLECIANDKRHAMGKALDADAAARIDKTSMAGKHWTVSQFAEAYPRLLKQIVSSRPAWFSDDTNAFWECLVEVWQGEGFAGLPGSPADVHPPYQREFSGHPSVVLIPAKRELETTTQPQAYEDVHPDGRGVLNYLFKSKNQDESSSLRKNFDAISAAFHDISAGYAFEVFFQPTSGRSHPPPPAFVELRFRHNRNSWIQAAHCGLGLHDLLIILYFALTSEHEVVLLEEPENHIHPEMQRRLATFLRDRTQKQFFLATHSSVFLNTQLADRVFTCRITDAVHVENATSRASVLTELGYSIADNLVSDVIVLCEGPRDKSVLEQFFQKIGLLDRKNIKMWPLGGDIMDQLDLSVFQQSHQIIALVDGDPKSSHIRERFAEKCAALNIAVTRLKRYAIENYFSLRAIAAVMPDQALPAEIKELDHKRRVSDQLGFDVKKHGAKIAKEMTLDEIKGTDFERFLHAVANIADV